MKLTARQLRQIIREELRHHSHYDNVLKEADDPANKTAPKKFSIEVTGEINDLWKDVVISLAPGQGAIITVLGTGYATLEIWIQQIDSIGLVDSSDNLKLGVAGVGRTDLPSGVQFADGDMLVPRSHRGQIAGNYTGNFALENTGDVEVEFVVGARCLDN